MKKIIQSTLVCFLLFTALNSYAQDYNFGLRAGLNYSKLRGPLNKDAKYTESYDWNNGIHFGVTFALNMTDFFGFRTELAYNQIGTKYRFESNSAPYVFRHKLNREVRYGKMVRELDINNSYLHIPLMVFIKPHRKIELYGGLYAQVNILSTVGGTIDFTDPKDIDGYTGKTYSFIQSIDGNYFSDKVRSAKSRQILQVELDIKDDKELITMPRSVGAYYELDANEKKGNVYHYFDWGLEFGGSYYFNRSLYLGVTTMYGLTDVSNNKADVDYFNLGEYDLFKFKDDIDKNLSVQVSLGFKF